MMLKTSISVTNLFVVESFFLTFLCWGIDFPGSTMLKILGPLIFIGQLVYYKNYLLGFKLCDTTKIHATDSLKWLKYYIIWSLLCIVYGFFMANNYYEYKHLLQNSCSLFLPLLIFLFYKPDRVLAVYKFWYKYALFIGFIFFYDSIGFSQFYYSPLLFLFFFLPLFTLNWRIIIIVLWSLYLYGGYNLDAREQVLKAFAVLGFSFLCWCSKIFSMKFVKIVQAVSYLFVLFIFTYALPGFIRTISGNTDSELTEVVGGRGVDTRSLLYLDVISSSIENHYYIWGRSPSRGNDIKYSDVLFITADDDGYVDTTEFSRNERTANEMAFANIFTWEGLIGLFLYSMIYFKASFLAVNKSENMYIKYLGCFIAFRWSIGWIGDMNNFDISNLSLWSMIAMCYSPELRKMTDVEFKIWIRKIISR